MNVFSWKKNEPKKIQWKTLTPLFFAISKRLRNTRALMVEYLSPILFAKSENQEEIE